LLTGAEPAIAGMHRNDPVGEAGLRRSLSWIWLELGESEPARVQAQRAWDLVEASPQAGAVERFLTLESLVRATRASGGAVPPLLASECVDLAMGILAQERPALARALMELQREARSAGVAERTVDEQIDEVALELERDLASALPDDLRRAQQSLLVTRALTEAAVVLHRAGRTQESERLSRKLERLAERTLEPGGSAWLFFLWRAADAHLRATPPLAGRAEELALRLQEGCRLRDFPTDHWMLEAARDLIEEARAVQAGAEQ
jgi:hypothetical protein